MKTNGHAEACWCDKCISRPVSRVLHREDPGHTIDRLEKIIAIQRVLLERVLEDYILSPDLLQDIHNHLYKNKLK